MHLEVAVRRFDFERRRVERYLAALQGYPVPISAEWRITNQPRRLRILPLHYESHFGLSTSAQSWELPEELRGLYRLAAHLLGRTPPDSPIGRGIENIGQSAMDDDSDLAFLHVWNGIELFGKAYWLETRGPGSELKLDGTRKYLRASDVVPPIVRDFFDGQFVPDVDRLAGLRNTVAHGGRGLRPGSTPREYGLRCSKLAAITELAHGIMVNYLGHRRLIPQVPRPYMPRVLIPSYRAGPIPILPVDTSRDLAHPKPIRSGKTAPPPHFIRPRFRS